MLLVLLAPSAPDASVEEEADTEPVPAVAFAPVAARVEGCEMATSARSPS